MRYPPAAIAVPPRLRHNATHAMIAAGDGLRRLMSLSSRMYCGPPARRRDPTSRNCVQVRRFTASRKPGLRLDLLGVLADHRERGSGVDARAGRAWTRDQPSRRSGGGGDGQESVGGAVHGGDRPRARRARHRWDPSRPTGTERADRASAPAGSRRGDLLARPPVEPPEGLFWLVERVPVRSDEPENLDPAEKPPLRVHVFGVLQAIASAI